MPALINQIKSVWFRPLEFFSQTFSRQTQRETLIFAVVMMALGMTWKIARLFIAPAFHWLEFFDHLTAMLVAWVFYALALAIGSNVAGGSGGFREAFRLTAYLMVVYVFYLLLLPFYILLYYPLPENINSIPFLRIAFLFLVLGPLFIILGYIVIRFLYIAYVGLQEVHQVYGAKAVIVLALSLVAAVFMVIAVKTLVSAFMPE